MSPIAQFLAAHPEIYPIPNRTPTDGLIQNNYVGPQNGFLTNNQEDFKVDFTPGNVNKFNGFYSQGTGADFTTAIVPVFFPAHNTYPTKIAGASFVHTFSPTIINEVRLGFTRVRWNNGVPSDPSRTIRAERAIRRWAFLSTVHQQYVGSPAKASATMPATSARMPIRRFSRITLSTIRTTSPGSAGAICSRSAFRQRAISKTTSTPATLDFLGQFQVQRLVYVELQRGTDRIRPGRFRSWPHFHKSLASPLGLRRQPPVARRRLFPG